MTALSAPAARDGTVLAAAGLCVAGLAFASLFVGVGDLDAASVLSGNATAQDIDLLLVSRIPRTLAVLLSGMSLGIAAVLMQMLFRNRFVDPTTAGTAQAASLGLVVTTILAPSLPVIAKMGIAALASLAATFLFLRLVNRIPLRSVVIVPIVGLMLGGVIDALTTFLALRFDLLQSVGAWASGDFSGVLRGRYELLWIAGILAVSSYLAADRFTLAGLGEAFTTNLGLDYRRIVALGLVIVSLVTAVSVATVGSIPFLGLIVANVASLMLGDNLRRSLPFIALGGAGFLLVCDIAGRLIRFPYEIPVGTVAGVLGAAVFLVLVLRPRARVG